MFIDTHSHLYLGKLQNNIPEAIEHLHTQNFSHTIQIGTSVETSEICIQLAETYDIVRATVGVHPCEAQDIPIEEIPTQINILEKMIIKNYSSAQNSKLKTQNYLVGIGEIGFDHYHLSSDHGEAEKQKIRQIHWFHAQAELAKKHNLPVVIHTRNCREITLEEIKKSGLEKFVIHCFSEDWDFAKKILEVSAKSMISFTGILTYPRSISVQEVAKKCPLNRIMIETDAPYIIPEDMKGKTLYCEPVYSLSVFRKISELRSESSKEIEETLWNNSVSFFGL